MSHDGAPPVLIAGAGIGGLAAALALARQGLRVKVLEQAGQIGEIGAGIQLGPNAFTALDALGVGERGRALAVYVDSLRMMDALDESTIAHVPTGEDFRARFGNPYAVIHRADVHQALLEGVQAHNGIELLTSVRVARVTQSAEDVCVVDAEGRAHRGSALVGCDGVHSAVRATLVGDPARVSGHVVYRAVVAKADFPETLRINAPVLWAGPNCHLVHYPLRGGEQFNLVVTFHSDQPERWGVSDGSHAEVLRYFQGIRPRLRELLQLPSNWKRWATADRDPIGRWSFGRITLLGDAAHPMLQYMAQGACMALEDAVTLGAALNECAGDVARAFQRYEGARVARTARVVLAAREMGRLYHAQGVERLVRNDLWRGRTPQGFYDALQWLYGWRAQDCLAHAHVSAT